MLASQCFSESSGRQKELKKRGEMNLVLLWWIFYLWMIVVLEKRGCASTTRTGSHVWRRPVPGWRQSEESVALENRGFGFEEADFEVHFREQGKLVYFIEHAWSEVEGQS